MALPALPNLKRLRGERTLERLSEETGISVSQLSRYERGGKDGRDPKLADLRVLSIVLGTTIDEIIGEHDPVLFAPPGNTDEAEGPAGSTNETANFFRILMSRSKLRQVDLARRLSVEESKIQQWLNGSAPERQFWKPISEMARNQNLPVPKFVSVSVNDVLPPLRMRALQHNDCIQVEIGDLDRLSSDMLRQCKVAEGRIPILVDALIALLRECTGTSIVLRSEALDRKDVVSQEQVSGDQA